MPFITLYKGSIGLNTKLDPKNIKSNAEEDLIEFAEAVNISIDDRGLVSLRNGSVLINTGSYHSLFCKDGDCFVVQERTSDAAIIQIVSVSPFTTIGVRSGLTKGLRMAWDQSGGDTFYSNGVQNGFIRAGVSAAWPVNTCDNPDDDRQFLTEIPKASHIAFRQHGQVLIAVGKAVIANDFPFLYGLFCLRSGVVAAFEFDVTMLVAVAGGFFASDGKQTWFFRQMEGWYNYKQELVETASAIIGTPAYDQVKLADIISSNAEGFGKVWASELGVCLGTDSGTFINITKESINYPLGQTSGACLVKDGTIIHTTY
jgi:hypothetical protein